MDEIEAVDRAERMWRAGRCAEALELLKARVRAVPTEESSRRALVRFYRDLGAPDQAGRWAVALGEWATPRERDRTARLLAASRVAPVDLPGFLALPTGDLPAIVVELLPLVDEYRAAFQLSAEERRDAEIPAEDWRVIASVAAWVLSSAVFVFAAVISWAGALLGAAMTDIARWASVASLVLLAAGTALSGWTALSERRRAFASALLATAVLLVLGVVTIIVRAVGDGGAIRFVWER